MPRDMRKIVRNQDYPANTWTIWSPYSRVIMDKKLIHWEHHSLRIPTALIFTMKAPHPRKPLSLGPRRTVSHPIHSPITHLSAHLLTMLSAYYVPATEWDAGDERLKRKNWGHSLGRSGPKMIKGHCAQTTAKQAMLCGKAAPNSSPAFTPPTPQECGAAWNFELIKFSWNEETGTSEQKGMGSGI